MANYNVVYDNKKYSQEELDKQCIKDIQDYLTASQWALFLELSTHPETTIKQIDVYFGFVGIVGRPFYAFCRTYMFNKYMEWAKSEGLKVDEKGYLLQ